MSKKQIQAQKKSHKQKQVKLDLACGLHKAPGFIGVDITKEGTQADIAQDLLSFPWPFEDESVDELFVSHFIEHIPHGNRADTDMFFDFFNEAWRILKPGGSFRIIAPYYTSIRATQDPTHHRAISEYTFMYLDKNWRCKINQLSHYPIKTNFIIEELIHALHDEWQGKSTEALKYAGTHNWNVIADINVLLRKPKK